MLESSTFFPKLTGFQEVDQVWDFQLVLLFGTLGLSAMHVWGAYFVYCKKKSAYNTC